MRGSNGLGGKAAIGLFVIMGCVAPLQAVGFISSAETGVVKAAGSPAAPTNLRLIFSNLTDVALEWDDNSDNETQFQIERRTFDGDFEQVATFRGTTPLLRNHQPDTVYIFRVRAENGAGTSSYSNELAVSTETQPSTCVADAESLCLQNDRFKVKAYWESEQGQRGRGKAVKLTPESGYFWFFNQDNVEVLVKILNGCVPNFRHWMFAAGLTDQRVIWTATDTMTGYVKTYQNPLKTQFTPVLDVDFGTCP